GRASKAPPSIPTALPIPRPARASGVTNARVPAIRTCRRRARRKCPRVAEPRTLSVACGVRARVAGAAPPPLGYVQAHPTEGDATMTTHATGTRDEWLAARRELLEAEKEHTRKADELARRRQALPWVRIDKDYRFDTDEGNVSLVDLFRGRSQLLVYHF